MLLIKKKCGNKKCSCLFFLCKIINYPVKLIVCNFGPNVELKIKCKAGFRLRFVFVLALKSIHVCIFHPCLIDLLVYWLGCHLKNTTMKSLSLATNLLNFPFKNQMFWYMLSRIWHLSKLRKATSNHIQYNFMDRILTQFK